MFCLKIKGKGRVGGLTKECRLSFPDTKSKECRIYWGLRDWATNGQHEFKNKRKKEQNVFKVRKQKLFDINLVALL